MFHSTKYHDFPEQYCKINMIDSLTILLFSLMSMEGIYLPRILFSQLAVTFWVIRKGKREKRGEQKMVEKQRSREERSDANDQIECRGARKKIRGVGGGGHLSMESM